ncbi:MAG: hypothetical protein EA398_17670 [Deltaproteobacteria bacterium]|nr:MAG: hypothetical protein EA398_17670 [Deltaproteobacteria bacterium]
MLRTFPLATALGGLLVLAVSCDRSTDDLFPDQAATAPAPPAAAPADPATRSHDAPPAPRLADPEAPAPRAVDTGGVAMPPAEAARSARERITVDTPEHWEEQPPTSSMRVAQWTLLADDGLDPGECVLFHFPGGGDPESNLLRWIAQFEQPDGSANDAHTFRATREVSGVPVSMVRVAGTYLDQNPPMTGPIVRREGWALIGAVFAPATGDPWFLKCTGPAPVMDAHEGAVAHFVDSFRLRDAP